MTTPYTHLSSPLKVGSTVLKNRMIKAPQGSDLFNPDQTVSDAEMDFCESIAAGGSSLICLACCQVVPIGEGDAQPSLCDDKFIPGLRRLTDMVHSHDSKIVAQLIPDGASALINPFCSSGVTK